jgi:hypothetical protein
MPFSLCRRLFYSMASLSIRFSACFSFCIFSFSAYSSFSDFNHIFLNKPCLLCLSPYLPEDAILPILFFLVSWACRSLCDCLFLSYAACHSILFFHPFFSQCVIFFLSLSSSDRLSHIFCHPSRKAYSFSHLFSPP